MYAPNFDDTIVALSTAQGTAAIAVIRISGMQAFDILETIFKPNKKNKQLRDYPPQSVVLGKIYDDNDVIDEVLVSIFKRPKSFTGEDVLEIACHGSMFIQNKILQLLINKGARMAAPGEFTLRGFVNGKFDLSQAEAIADLIAADNKMAHNFAMKQMRGEFSNKINTLRQELINFASLLTLELDFSEEDVEFANRDQLMLLVNNIQHELGTLLKSFKLGNALKNGVPVAIVGQPNVGKSTLLNALLGEEKAIVSDIPGTTRDSIEDTINIDNITFRFIDTAGIRHTTDQIETIGIQRTFEKINQAQIILYLIDSVEATETEMHETIQSIKKHTTDNQHLIIVANKIDKAYSHGVENLSEIGNKLKHFDNVVFTSAKQQKNIDLLKQKLKQILHLEKFEQNAIVVTNTRHYEAINKALQAINKAYMGLKNNLPTELLSIDIAESLKYLGDITGQITNEDILQNIFSKFCIGK